MTSDARVVRERLDAADGPGALLAAGWDGFDCLGTLAGELADPGSACYPALMMAALAAAAGRDAVGYAPSMPATAGPARRARPWHQ